MILGFFQALSVSASKPRASGDDPDHENAPPAFVG